MQSEYQGALKREAGATELSVSYWGPFRDSKVEGSHHPCRADLFPSCYLSSALFYFLEFGYGTVSSLKHVWKVPKFRRGGVSL